MLRGIYTSASGMLVETLKTDVVANNLANAHTHGFKKQVTSVRSFPDIFLHRINDPVPGRVGDPRPPVGRLGTGAAIESFSMDMSAGPVKFTGRALDVALLGPGFFSVELPNGETAYTRDGNFELDADGFIVTMSGARVLGLDGPIWVGQHATHIDDEGNVWVDQEMVDRLAVVEFASPDMLERLGDNLVSPTETSGAPVASNSTTIRSEYLELANVVVVKEMVDLIATQRAYEANQRMITAHDETLGRLINEAANLS